MSEQNTKMVEETVVLTPDFNRVDKKTIKKIEPQAKGEAPQKVFDKKRTIIRLNQIIWYILGLVEVLLAFRVVLKILGANQFVGFTNFVYLITSPITNPFNGILGLSSMGNSIIEWSTLIAAIVYLCIAWGITYLLEIMNPITPNDIEV